jgi:hypothetical protein
MTNLYGEQWGLVLLLSFLLTWCIGLAPPLLIRFAFMRRPLGKGWAIGVVAILWVFNIVLFTALGSQSKTHGALALVAFISYGILRKGTKNKTTLDPSVEYEAASSENIPIISNSTFCDEDEVYDQIAKEFETGVEDNGLWTRLFADCDGDETKTKVLYIKKRADRLIAAKRADMEKTTQEAPSNINKSDKKGVESNSFKKDYWATNKSQPSKRPPHDHQERSVLNDDDDISECPKCGMENRIQKISVGLIQKCDKCGNVEYFKEKKMDETSWQNRVLCSDDSCIGVIGKDGQCNTCGKKREIELPRNNRSK